MTFRQLKQCNLIDIRAFYDTEEYGIRAKHSYVELSRSIPHEQLFYYAIPCYNEGVYWYSKGKYIYWKLQEVNSSEHFISVYLRYYFLNDGIWSCGPSGTVKYVLNFSVSEPWIEDNFNTLEDCEQKANDLKEEGYQHVILFYKGEEELESYSWEYVEQHKI